MNDFTKEELIILFTELNITIRNWGDAKEYKDYPRLKDKIQSMIGNYPECKHLWVRGKCHDCGIERKCEHESDGHTYYKSGVKCTDFLTYASSESPCYLKCKKCGELYR
jgi:hypothetical protein